ncbi:DUF4279 domain-containing protein [Sphingobacterium thalpophilum]|uniref:DUF4279 domain-containing protein n=1 Tax=Sphingobacterium thalpophilum TaxID=259 RepID=A0A4U9W277_9SPHI|nr:DUF4279 domain-containing protein [Sphingobacterium thalpophilum]VTR52744.1 Uncharacterised protein [Sphingobacterium thalpophilum]
MKGDYFIYKTYCELVIVSNEISPNYITDNLGVVPTRSFQKGERSVSKHSGSTIIKPHNLWASKSVTTELEEESISQHIDYFRSIFFSKIDLLKKYKEDNRFDVTFWVWIETDNAGIGLGLNEDELDFLNKITNRMSFSITCNRIEEE